MHFNICGMIGQNYKIIKKTCLIAMFVNNKTNKLKNNKDTQGVFIIFGSMSVILLGILIWQLIVSHFYNKLPFYYGTLVILGYLSLLYYLLSKTRRSKKLVLKILSWLLVVLFAMFPAILEDFSQIFNAPPSLFLFAYYLIMFLLIIIFNAIGLIRVKMDL
jgi:UDP-N-acetylmuramyl pentapeptide phosphotransferase/UDP-N-acetylglucosamine-1-phosphate transferase